MNCVVESFLRGGHHHRPSAWEIKNENSRQKPTRRIGWYWYVPRVLWFHHISKLPPFGSPEAQQMSWGCRLPRGWLQGTLNRCRNDTNLSLLLWKFLRPGIHTPGRTMAWIGAWQVEKRQDMIPPGGAASHVYSTLAAFTVFRKRQGIQSHRKAALLENV